MPFECRFVIRMVADLRRYYSVCVGFTATIHRITAKPLTSADDTTILRDQR